MTSPLHRPIRVLVVDDSSTMRMLVERIVQSDPDLVVTGATACAEEALGWLAGHRPDVITLDIEMPGIGGLGFLARLCPVDATPVIMLSSHTARGEAVCAEATKLGAYACFDKKKLVSDSRALLKTIRAAVAAPRRVLA